MKALIERLHGVAEALVAEDQRVVPEGGQLRAPEVATSTT